jgi:hypothetical protein
MITVSPLGSVNCWAWLAAAAAVGLWVDVGDAAGIDGGVEGGVVVGVALWALACPVVSAKPATARIVKRGLNIFIEWSDCRNSPNVLVFS